jgi:hypothetical protein
MAAALKPRARAARVAVAWGLLVLGVVAVHGCVMNEVGDLLAALQSPSRMPERLEVRYVREMAVAAAAPLPAAAAAPRRAAPIGAPSRPRKARVPSAAADDPPPPAAEAAASAPEPAASDPVVAQAPASAVSGHPGDDDVALAAATSASAPEASGASSAAASASPPAALPAGPAPEPAAPSAVDSVWPQSTRVRYTGSGYYRGEISGSASVEWVRVGNRYQMHMDVRMGLFQRRATSQGRIEAQGVVPERYDESNKVLFGSERRATLLLEGQAVELADGQRLPRPPGLQDTTSQFVQLTYLFSTQPDLLRPGQSIEFPLAFPRRIRAYAYEVRDVETLHTPFGPLQALHVKPRRVEAKDRDLVAEAWFAPQLNYLPVRIRISQGEETYIDLLIAKPPELAR